MGWKRVHAVLTIVWAVLIIPSVVWWRNSVPWLVLMSAWANFAAHFSAWQGARAEASSNNENDAPASAQAPTEAS